MCMTQAQVSYTEMSSLLSLGPRVPSNWWFGVSEAIFRCKRERSIMECFNYNKHILSREGGGGGVWVEGEREEAGAAQLIVTKIGGTVKVQ